VVRDSGNTVVFCSKKMLRSSWPLYWAFPRICGAFLKNIVFDIKVWCLATVSMALSIAKYRVYEIIS
jgi:hypothetical protein